MLPREKFFERGIDSLSDSDLIAILVGSGCRKVSFSEISVKVLRKVRELLKNEKQLEIGDLREIEGVGDITAMKILSGIELGRRIYFWNKEEKEVLRNSKEAYEYLKKMRSLKQENIVGIFLNARFEVLKKKTIAIGTFDRANVLPRDIIIPALEVNASSVILAHNHPSGTSEPSHDDIIVTKRIKESLELVGIELLEHLVISEKGWYSIEI
jgi:DNA repair protein RadC